MRMTATNLVQRDYSCVKSVLLDLGGLDVACLRVAWKVGCLLAFTLGQYSTSRGLVTCGAASHLVPLCGGLVPVLGVGRRKGQYYGELDCSRIERRARLG